MTNNKLAYDTDTHFVEIDLRKAEGLLYGTYRRRSQSNEHHLKNIGHASDFFVKNITDSSFLVMSTRRKQNQIYQIFYSTYDTKNVVKSKAYFKKPINPRCIYFLLQIAFAVFRKLRLYLVDCQIFTKITLTMSKSTFQNLILEKIFHRNYKKKAILRII